jgi:hypothetical protein
VSVKLEMVPNSHLTAANVNKAGSEMAKPVKKHARHCVKIVFFTS